MRERKLIKYGILVTLIVLILIQNIHIGDFCEGMSEGLIFMFLVICSFLVFLIIILRDVYRLIIKKDKFDFLPLLLLFVCILSNWFIHVANENRFWKQIKYEGRIDNDDINTRIILYENKTYEVIKSYVEQRCTYGGKYHFEKNILILEDENIENKTDNYFTSKYVLTKENILQPKDNEHLRIKLNTK